MTKELIQHNGIVSFFFVVGTKVKANFWVDLNQGTNPAMRRRRRRAKKPSNHGGRNRNDFIHKYSPVPMSNYFSSLGSPLPPPPTRLAKLERGLFFLCLNHNISLWSLENDGNRNNINLINLT